MTGRRKRQHKESDELPGSAPRRLKRDSGGSVLDTGQAAILGLQASVGNAAVARLVSRVAAPAEPTLRYGSQGPEVAKAQRLLNLAGASLSDDGVFGRQTVGAAKEFQSSRGLVPDGVIGRMTWAALHASSVEFASGEGAAELGGKEGGFEAKEGGFEAKEGGFEAKEGGFEAKEGGFEAKEFGGKELGGKEEEAYFW
jgi:peptidoglycan hydrolase-like protein with peptidoglycan-binding domain